MQCVHLFSLCCSCCLESVSAGNTQYQLLHVMSCSESAFNGLIGSISGLETLSHSGDNQDKGTTAGCSDSVAQNSKRVKPKQSESDTVITKCSLKTGAVVSGQNHWVASNYG